MDDSVSHVLVPGGSAPANDVLRFVNAPTKIRSVTVLNQSQLSIELYPGALRSDGNPRIVVGPLQQQTIPIDSVPYITVAYLGNVIQKGFIYIHYADDYVAPSNSPLQLSHESVPWTAVSKLNFVIGTQILLLARFIVSDAPGFARVSNLLSLTHLSLSQMPADTVWDLKVVNEKMSETSNYGGIGLSGPSYEADFANPYPMYNIGSNPMAPDIVGDFLDVNLSITATASGTLYYTTNWLAQ